MAINVYQFAKIFVAKHHSYHPCSQKGTENLGGGEDPSPLRMQ